MSRQNSHLLVGKGKECVTIDVEGLYISAPSHLLLRLKRLQFDKAVSLPLEHSGVGGIPLLGVALVGKSNEGFIVYYKRRASMTGSLCSNLLKLFKLVIPPFVDDC